MLDKVQLDILRCATAQAMGGAAFKRGIESNPNKDTEFVEFTNKLPIGETDKPLLVYWIKGYNKEKLFKKLKDSRISTK